MLAFGSIIEKQIVAGTYIHRNNEKKDSSIENAECLMEPKMEPDSIKAKYYSFYSFVEAVIVEIFSKLEAQEMQMVIFAVGACLLNVYGKCRTKIPKMLFLITLFYSVLGTFVGEKLIGNSGYDIGFSIVRSSDGNYYIAGYSYLDSLSTYRVLFMKISNTFSPIFIQYFGSIGNYYSYSMCSTNSERFAIVGRRSSTSSNAAYVIIVDNTGNLLLEKFFGSSSGDFAYSVKCLSDNTCVIVGQKEDNNKYTSWMFLINASGTQIFSNIISYSDRNYLRSVDISENSNFIAAGSFYSLNNIYNGMLVKFDFSGNLLWKREYEMSSSRAYLHSVVVGPVSNFFACGYSGTIVSGFFLMTNTNGDLLWKREYNNGTQSSVCYSVENTPDNNYAAAGYIVSSDTLKNRGWVLKLTFQGIMSYMETFDNDASIVLIKLITESDEGFVAVGYTWKDSSSDALYKVYIRGGYFNCSAGYYILNSVCTICPAGTYSSESRASECTPCAAGFYQPLKGQTSCIVCPVGTCQPFPSQTECNSCQIGTYSSTTGNLICSKCENEFYQDNIGQSSCKACETGYYSNILGSACLYKGIFSNEEAFLTSSFKENCYDSNFKVILPYSEACRTSYRSLCCKGSSILSSSGPICNIGLNITSTSSLYNNYCGACPFLDQTQCPAQGVCWNDLLFTSNSYNPYSDFSYTCIEAIEPYCREKLATDANNGECYMFSKICTTATIASVSYGTSYSSFLIVTNQKISSDTLSNDIFINDFSAALLSKKSTTEIIVTISAMESPPRSFQFKPGGLKNMCKVSFSDSIVHSITMPTVTFETVSISSSNSPVNLCKVLNITSYVNKPYSWNVEYTWRALYKTTSTPSEFTTSVEKVKTDYITFNPDYLLAGQTLEVSLTITSPFSKNILSNALTFELQYPNDSLFPCSPCQFYNRTKCLNFDSACWDSYTIYSPSYPLLYSENCLSEIASECYAIWTQNSTSDLQCKNFVSYFDLSKMSVKPNVSSSVYYIDGTLKLRITFDTEVKTKLLSTCNAIFDENTLASLGSSAQCSWKSARILEIEYSTSSSLMTNLTLRENAIFYNYKYAANPADSVILTPTKPDLSGTLSISAASEISSCNALLLTAVTQVAGIFEYSYIWRLSYSSTSVSPTILTNLESLASLNAKILVVSPTNLISEENLQVSLTVHVPLLNADIVATKSIHINSDTPEVQFASSELYQLNLIGNQTNDLGLVIKADPCNTGSNTESEITFRVYSGTVFSNIQTRGFYEGFIENILFAKYNFYKTLQANINSGFQYNHFYNLTVCARLSGKNVQSCKTKILGIFKPAISAVIMGLPSFVGGSDSIIFNGARSSIPLETDETVKFTWQCTGCYSYVSNSQCACPYLTQLQASSRAFSLSTSKLTHSQKYKFRLTITSVGGMFLRTGSAETSFITISCAVSNVYGRLIQGKQNDLYFTVTVNYGGLDSDLSFQWSLIEVSSTLPNNILSYSMLNTFVYNLFLKNGITLNSVSTSEDKEIPDFLQPTNTTNHVNRIFGIDKSSLIPKYVYTFGVLMKEPSGYSAALLTIQAPALPASRSLDVTPTSGNGLETIFLFTFSVNKGTSNSEEILKLFSLNCDGSEELVYSVVGSSTSFKGVLSPGKANCNYQVTYILRVTLNEVSVDANVTVTVLSSTSPTTTAIATVLSQIKSTDSYINTLSTLSSVSQTSVSEESVQAKANIVKVYDLLSQIDDVNAGLVSQLDDSSKLQFLNSSLLILKNLMEKNKLSNLDLTLQNLIEIKIYSYISSCSTISDAVYLIPSAIRALSASASLKKKRGGKQSYTNIELTLEKMRLMKLQNLLPGGPSYQINSTMISLKMFKQYGTDFNLSHEVTSNGGTNSDSALNTQTRIELPAGLTTKVIKSLPFFISSYTTFMVCTSISLLKFNPYENVKTNALVYLSAINSLSYNTNWIEAEVVKAIYQDLRRGELNEIVDIYSQDVDLIQLSFNGFSLQKDASIIEYGYPVKIGILENDSKIKYHHPYSSTQESRDNLIMLPFFKVGKYWANLNFTLLNIKNDEITSESAYLGYPGDYTTGHTADITVDVIPNTKDILFTGAYLTLPGFNLLTQDAGSIQMLLIFCAIIFVVMILFSFILYVKDKTRITKERLKTLEYLVVAKELPPANGFIQETFRFLFAIKRKGMKNLTQEKQSNIYPEFVPSTTRSIGDIDTTNGYSSINEEEKQNLAELYSLYQSKKRTHTEEELLAIFKKELENCPPLNRRTRDYIEDTSLGYAGFVLLLLQQQFASAFFMVSLSTTRPIKLLLVTLTLFGELAVVGLFIDPSESEDVFDRIVLMSLVLCFLALVVVLPMKILLDFFLSAFCLTDTMSREEIIKKEKCFSFLEKIGYALMLVFFILEFFAIETFASTFNGTAFKLWLISFAVTFFIENVICFAFKMLLLISYASCLRGSSAGRCFLICIGVLSCYCMECVIRILI